MKRRLVTRHGRRVRGRSGGRVALLAIFLGALTLCVLSFGGALANLSQLIDADFFDAALAHELSRPSARTDSLLEASLTPAVNLVEPSELSRRPSPSTQPSVEPSGTPKPSAEPGATEPPSTPSIEPSGAPSSDPAPTREPNAADLDPNIRTVTVAPGSTDGYCFSDGVYIKNGTKFDVDVRSYLEAVPEFEKKPHILIVHTHACEAYYPDGDDMYEPTDVERTEDTNFNVVRVGDELEKLLSERGFSVEHIREIFDYPSYNGSYTRTLKAIQSALDEDSDISIVIDLHRDAIEGADGSTWRTVSDVDGKLAAQSMFVVGTDEGGLQHPNWRQNLLLAVHLQKYITDRYPTLMRPITLSPSRYNQHATSGSLILEVGTSGNTLDEALYSIQLLGGAMCDFLEELCA